MAGYATCRRFHAEHKNFTVLDQCWEYHLNKDIEFLLGLVDELTEKTNE